MNDTVERVIRASVSSTRDSQLSELAVMGWLTNEQFSQLSAEAIKEMIGIIDPVSDKRMAMIRQAMSDELTKAMIEAEPEIREGIALSYARRFTPQQLAEINAFLGTPTGSLSVDPIANARYTSITGGRATQILKSATAYFAAELDRPSR